MRALTAYDTYENHICYAALILARIQFSYPSTKPFVVGTQNNRLIETVVLSTHNIC